MRYNLLIGAVMPEEDCSQRDASSNLNNPEQDKIAKFRLQTNMRESLQAFFTKP